MIIINAQYEFLLYFLSCHNYLLLFVKKKKKKKNIKKCIELWSKSKT